MTDPVALPLEGHPLTEAHFVERPNRFLVRARLGGTSATGTLEAEPQAGPDPGQPSGTVVSAHLPDPGRLKELLVPGRRLFLRAVDDPRRKTRWSVVLAQTPDGEDLVSVDTSLPNRLIQRALEASALPELSRWSLERSEVRVGRSRFDFLLSGPTSLVLEVKSVTLVEDGVGLFPDAVTDRGRRHVEELEDLAREAGRDAAILFVLQRRDAGRIRAAPSIDPAFAQALQSARKAGVRVLGRRCRVTPARIELDRPIPVD